MVSLALRCPGGSHWHLQAYPWECSWQKPMQSCRMYTTSPSSRWGAPGHLQAYHGTCWGNSNKNMFERTVTSIEKMSRGVNGCGKNFAMKCFVFLRCTCSALYCSYLGCLSTQTRRAFGIASILVIVCIYNRVVYWTMLNSFKLYCHIYEFTAQC